jgi:hypothetical protein
MWGKKIYCPLVEKCHKNKGNYKELLLSSKEHKIKELNKKK